MPITGFLRAWVAGLVGFLVGEYGAGALLRVVRDSSGDQAMLDVLWLPWIAAPVLCGIAAALALPHAERARWWHWLVGASVVPVGAAGVTLVVVSLVGAEPSGFWLSVAVQIVIAAVLALGIGTLRTRRAAARPAPVPPVTYVPQEGDRP